MQSSISWLYEDFVFFLWCFFFLICFWVDLTGVGTFSLCVEASNLLQVSNDGESRTSAVMERPTNHAEDNLPEADNFSEDDFLELDDLDQPLSPSSSSDNSSCMTLSSDEYFDHLALLQELEPCKNKGVGPENAEYKYSFSTSHTPNEVVIFPGNSILVFCRNVH